MKDSLEQQSTPAPEAIDLDELNSEDFFSTYLRALPDSEVPQMFHRWSAIVGVGAWIGRDAHFQHMDYKVFPNLYAMLIADSGVRKSTAIKTFTNLLRKAGYKTFAANKTSKEQFLIDLADVNKDDGTNLTDLMFGDGDDESARSSNMFAAPDEFNELFGNNILEFVSMLGTLWDFDGTFENKVKNSASVRIPNPCISLLGGNTPATLYATFPVEAIGQGFFSRLLFIHSPPTGKKIAFPGRMSEETKDKLIESLKKIKETAHGEMRPNPAALKYLETCYKSWPGMHDPRFASYANRRFTQLLKLTTIHALADYSREIKTIHVVRANTVLTQAEKFMAAGLGEFGKAYHAEVVHKIMQRLEGVVAPVKFEELWEVVHMDLNRPGDLQEIMSNLLVAKKVEVTKVGFLGVKKVAKETASHLLDWNYLSIEERTLT